MKKVKLRNFKQSVTQESWYFNQCNLSRARIRMGPYTGILLVWSAIIKRITLYFGIQQSSVILLSLMYIHLGQLHLPPTTSTIISPLTIHKSVFPVLSNFILVQIYMSNCSLKISYCCSHCSTVTCWKIKLLLPRFFYRDRDRTDLCPSFLYPYQKSWSFFSQTFTATSRL